jgi:hypothetical protein
MRADGRLHPSYLSPSSLALLRSHFQAAQPPATYSGHPLKAFEMLNYVLRRLQGGNLEVFKVRA